MLTAFARAFRTPDLRKKLLFTLGVIALFRFGSQIPAPGVDLTAVNKCLAPALQDNQLFALVNLFSGGALLQLSIFALGIMPYITASIIIQLLTVVIPRFEVLKKEGQAGQAKLTQYTRYLTVALAVLQSTGIIATARAGQLFPNCPENVIYSDVGVFGTIVMVFAMTAGTAIIMWLGELITDRGVGNGMSLLIFTSIAAGFPASLWAIKEGSQYGDGWPVFFAVIGIGLLIVAAVVFVEQAQRRIPVQYAKRMIGRRMYGGSSTYIPLKVNQAGVIPVIFASSLLYIPALVVNLMGQDRPKWATWIDHYFVRGDHLQPAGGRRQHEEVWWFHPGHPGGPADRGVPRLHPDAADLARFAVPGAHLAHPDDRVVGHPAGQPELPVRWNQHPDYRRCGAGDREADRKPAPAA